MRIEGKRGGGRVWLWRLSEVGHRLHDPTRPRVAAVVQPLRADEERLDHAAVRLGMTVSKLRWKVDGFNGRWRYAADSSHVVVALPIGELRRLGIERPDQSTAIEIAGIRCFPPRELVERELADFIAGGPVHSWPTGNPVGAEGLCKEPNEYVSVEDLAVVLMERRDATGLALLLRLLNGEIRLPGRQSVTREALLLDCMCRPTKAC